MPKEKKDSAEGKKDYFPRSFYIVNFGDQNEKNLKNTKILIDPVLKNTGRFIYRLFSTRESMPYLDVAIFKVINPSDVIITVLQEVFCDPMIFALSSHGSHE